MNNDAHTMVAKSAGLFGVQVSDFAFEGATAEGKPFKYLIGVLGARSFTLKCAAKSELVSVRMIDRSLERVIMFQASFTDTYSSTSTTL